MSYEKEIKNLEKELEVIRWNQKNVRQLYQKGVLGNTIKTLERRIQAFKKAEKYDEIEYIHSDGVANTYDDEYILKNIACVIERAQ